MLLVIPDDTPWMSLESDGNPKESCSGKSADRADVRFRPRADAPQTAANLESGAIQSTVYTEVHTHPTLTRRPVEAMNCGDAAACKGFFGLLKRERVYRTKYTTLDVARADLFEHIERFHNPRMRRRTAKQI